MTQSSYRAGYGRDQTQEVQPGRPSGRAGPKNLTKAAFDTALNDALNADRKALLEARPNRVIEAFARALVVDALDGRASAQRLVLARLDRAAADDTGPGEKERGDGLIPQSLSDEASAASGGQAHDEGEDDEVLRRAQDEGGEEGRFVYDDENARQLLGDRYGEFKARFECAVNANDLDALADLGADFAIANPPCRREKSREP